MAVADEKTEVTQMHGRLLKIEEERIRYARRLDMAKDLIRQSGRRDWAVRLGMVIDTEDDAPKLEYSGVSM